MENFQAAQGLEWIIDAIGCSAAALADPEVLAGLFRQVIADLMLLPVGDPLWHKFPPPGGLTGLWLLKESHLCCHTFPETGYAAFNLYCCRPRPDWPWQKELQARLSARDVAVRCLRRGGLA